MSLNFSDYLLFKKHKRTLAEFSVKTPVYDRFVGGYNTSERVATMFACAKAREKHWMVFPQYGLKPPTTIAGEHVFVGLQHNEDEYIVDYFERFPLQPGEKICFDLTGFLRPHIMFLLRYLFSQQFNVFDCIYTEPLRYGAGADTVFSREYIDRVDSVRGYEASGRKLSAKDSLVVGCGYDTSSMRELGKVHLNAKKIFVFSFPSLRPHMYQENRIRTAECSDVFGPQVETHFAPAFDPFVTAEKLEYIVNREEKLGHNIILSSLATKAQVLGFALCYLKNERRSVPISIVHPYSSGYSPETSVGIASVWSYEIDFGLLVSGYFGTTP